MADLNTALPPALRRALELLADAPTNPDVGKGYLDLLGARPVEDAAVPKNTRAQALFASPVAVIGMQEHFKAVALQRGSHYAAVYR
jgi:arsenite methyltransferase